MLPLFRRPDGGVHYGLELACNYSSISFKFKTIPYSECPRQVSDQRALNLALI